MVRQARHGFMVLGVTGLAFVGMSCAMPGGQRVTLSQGGDKPPPALSVHTPINKIAANPGGKAVLDRDVPGVMSNPHYDLFSSMSLSQLATLSGGRLNQAKLKQVDQDLAELSPGQ
ncbi:hypothetical protein [Acidocella sp.]|uniref:hypothetical protein n=1 Tax=Acidocella sp. TaxID=50710 RepID=UPI00260C4657|nr:hypothetical protein [Acidocella sp.]